MYHGFPGHGKTYEAVRIEILGAIKDGRRVLTNIDSLDFGALSELSGVSQDEIKELITVVDSDELLKGSLPELVKETEEGERGEVIVIDEAQNIWPKDERLPIAVRKFFTKHRHYGVDIVLLTQVPATVHKQITSITEVFVWFKKMRGMSEGHYYKEVWLGGCTKRTGDCNRTFVRKFDPAIFGCYKSVVCGIAGLEGSSVKLRSFYKRPSIILAVLFLFVAFPYAIYFAYGIFDTSDPELPGAPGVDSAVTSGVVSTSKVVETGANGRGLYSRAVDFWIGFRFSVTSFVVVTDDEGVYTFTGYLEGERDGGHPVRLSFADAREMGFKIEWARGNNSPQVFELTYPQGRRAEMIEYGGERRGPPPAQLDGRGAA